MRALRIMLIAFSLILVCGACAPVDDSGEPRAVSSSGSATSGTVSSGSSSSGAPALSDAELRNMIRETLSENPSLIMDILWENDEEMLKIVESGSRKARVRAMKEQWKADMDNPLNPDIPADRLIKGPDDAAITIVEYSDFQCPYCSRAAMDVNALLDRHAGDIRVLFKHAPLPMHEKAEVAARYFEAAGLREPEAAWRLHDIMFMSQQELSRGGEEWLKKTVESLGLDPEQTAEDAWGQEVSDRLAADAAEAKQFGITGTPHFLFNGVSVRGAVGLENFEELVEMIMAREAGGVRSIDAAAPTPPEDGGGPADSRDSPPESEDGPSGVADGAGDGDKTCEDCGEKGAPYPEESDEQAAQ